MNQKGFWQIIAIVAVVAIGAVLLSGAFNPSKPSGGGGNEPPITGTGTGTSVEEPEIPDEPEVLPAEGFLSCATGDEGKPRVLYSWKWADIPENLCDADNEDGVYCDATQFSIAFLKKYKAFIDGTLSREEMESFEVRLMKDFLTGTFKNDFVDYYTTASFADAPTWFTEEDGLSKAFDRTSFSQTITQPGIYKVTIQNLPSQDNAGLETGFVEECVETSDGCLQWEYLETCTDNKVCSDGFCTAGENNCVDEEGNSYAEGEKMCDPSREFEATLKTCEFNDDTGTLEWVETECTGKICEENDDGELLCLEVEEGTCSENSIGDTKCDVVGSSNVVQECQFDDGEKNWVQTEACSGACSGGQCSVTAKEASDEKPVKLFFQDQNIVEATGGVEISSFNGLVNSSYTMKWNGSNYSRTFKEKLFVNGKLVGSDPYEFEIKSGGLKYILDLGNGIPVYESTTSTLEFYDGSNDNVVIPFFGENYLVEHATSAKVVLVKPSETTVFNTNDVIPDLTGKNSLDGQTVSVRIDSIVATEPEGSYNAEVTLIDEDGTDIATKTVGPGEFINEALTVDGQEAIEAVLYVDSIGVSASNGIGTINIIVSTDFIVVYDKGEGGEGYPYDLSTNTSDHDFEADLTYSNDGKYITKIEIANDEKEWIGSSALNLNQGAVFLDLIEGTPGYRFFTAWFRGIGNDASTAVLDITLNLDEGEETQRVSLSVGFPVSEQCMESSIEQSLEDGKKRVIFTNLGPEQGIFCSNGNEACASVGMECEKIQFSCALGGEWTDSYSGGTCASTDFSSNCQYSAVCFGEEEEEADDDETPDEGEACPNSCDNVGNRRCSEPMAVEFELVDRTGENNPFYYLPLNLPLGFSGESETERLDYGVKFILEQEDLDEGQSVRFNDDEFFDSGTESGGAFPTTFEFVDRFSTSNNTTSTSGILGATVVAGQILARVLGTDNRNTLMAVSLDKRTTQRNVALSYSIPTPLIMEIDTEELEEDDITQISKIGAEYRYTLAPTRSLESVPYLTEWRTLSGCFEPDGQRSEGFDSRISGEQNSGIYRYNFVFDFPQDTENLRRLPVQKSKITMTGVFYSPAIPQDSPVLEFESLLLNDTTVLEKGLKFYAPGQQGQSIVLGVSGIPHANNSDPLETFEELFELIESGDACITTSEEENGELRAVVSWRRAALFNHLHDELNEVRNTCFGETISDCGSLSDNCESVAEGTLRCNAENTQVQRCILQDTEQGECFVWRAKQACLEGFSCSTASGEPSCLQE